MKNGRKTINLCKKFYFIFEYQKPNRQNYTDTILQIKPENKQVAKQPN